MDEDLLEEDKVKVELTAFTDDIETSKCLYSRSFELVNEAKRTTKTAMDVANQLGSFNKDRHQPQCDQVATSLTKAIELLDIALESLTTWENSFKENLEDSEFGKIEMEDNFLEDRFDNDKNDDFESVKLEDAKEISDLVITAVESQSPSGDMSAVKENKKTNRSAKFKCEMCHYSCDKVQLMKIHMKKKHHLIKVDYVCESIDHERKHYLCEHCSYSSKTIAAIQTHKKTCKKKQKTSKKVESSVTVDADNENSSNADNVLLHSEDDSENKSADGGKVKEYKCTTCSYVTSRKVYYDDHVAGSLKYRKCPWCQVHVSTGIKLITSHLRTKHGQGEDGSPFNCQDCGEKLKRLSSLELHLAKVHKRGVVYHCGNCKYTNPCLKTVRSHVSTHKGPFCCDICGAFLSSKASLRNHLEGKHGSKKYQCHLCSFSSTRKFGLTQHMSIHNGKILLCDQCEFTTVHKANFVKHMQRKHSKEPRKETKRGQFPCDVCSAKYSTSLGLKRHKKQHASPESISCGEAGCDYVTSRSDNLKHHHEKVHQGIRWPCSQCDYVGGYKSDLNRHVKFTHEGFLLKCELCKYTTPKKCRLNWHMTKVHQTTDSRWLCDACDFVAGYEGELNRHIKIVHNGFTLKCEYCDYATPKKYRLKCHVTKVHERKIAR